MDALSEVLKVLKLNAGLFLRAEFTAPWCIDSAPGKDDVRHILPGAEHVAIFHVLTEGECRARLPGDGETARVGRGDVIMFPHGDGHLLGSDMQLAPVDAATLVRPGPDGGLLEINHGGGGSRTRFVCGYLACDKRLCRPLLQAMPRMLHVPLGDGPDASWQVSSLERGAEESRAPGPGAEVMLARLSELLFVEALRRYMRTLPAEGHGFLCAVRDPQVGRALSMMHGDPGCDWTVEGLAGAIGVSRSVLAERFTTLLGDPPMQYLTRWRMALAARALASGGEAIARIAADVGYESEAAFNRAFKREFGLPPATWRRTTRGARQA